MIHCHGDVLAAYAVLSGRFDLSTLRCGENPDPSLSGEFVLFGDVGGTPTYTAFEQTLCGTLSRHAHALSRGDYASWAERPKLILVDESGNMDREYAENGAEKEGASRTLTMTAVVTDTPDTLSKIAKRTKTNTRYPWMRHPRDEGELKYRSSSDHVRQKVLRDIRNTEPIVYSVVVKKCDFPPPKVSNITIYKRTANELMEDVMADLAGQGVSGKIAVVYDSFIGFDDKKAAKLTIDIASKYRVEIKPEDISVEWSKKRKDLQAIDFATGAVGLRYNSDADRDFRVIAHLTKVREDVKIDESKKDEPPGARPNET